MKTITKSSSICGGRIMKKIFVLVSLVFLVQLACVFSFPTGGQSETQTAAAWTPTLDFTGSVFPGGADLYAGPGEEYPKIGFVQDMVTITGQGLGCTWFQVYSAAANMTGWLKADQMTYIIPCADVPGVPIPPAPEPTATKTLIPSRTFTLEPTLTFTKTQAQGFIIPTPGCPLQSQILLGNRTGTPATFMLVGPATFYFTVLPDIANRFPVCEGCYDVYLTSSACGDTSGTFVGRICDGFDGWFYCNQ
jgi:hypothetical protein